MSLAQPVTTALATLTLLSTIAGVFVLLLFIVLLLRKKTSTFYSHPLTRFITGRAYLFSFIVASAATLGSLFYSEIAGYEPCKLCWIQRIFMYPQVLILGTLLDKKKKQVRSYGTNLALVMSSIGGGFALYHYLLQRGVIPNFLECGTVGYSVSCTENFTMNYGFITIPFMALTAFAMIALFMLLSRRTNTLGG